ncbi:membrane hypothetical protein [Clostridioides difficile]|uniref:Uncharacterized protein n=1 Tax=Clostridioides difficile TaxID=1496 RepID=A0A069AU93_CLODI|nr:membrane hypothetical protein [Clostridioides difficile]
MLRITFPYILLISLSSFVGSVLNSYHKFGIPAFTPTFLNVSFIVFALFFVPYFDPPVTALAWAVFVGGILQLGFQLPWLAKLGFFETAQTEFQRCGGQPRDETDGACDFGRERGADFFGDQHDFRVLSAIGQRFMDVLRRPHDGTARRRAGGGTRYDFAADFVQTLGKPRYGTVFRPARLGFAPVYAADAAGGGRTGGVVVPAGGDAVYVPRIHAV